MSLVKYTYLTGTMWQYYR